MRSPNSNGDGHSSSRTYLSGLYGRVCLEPETDFNMLCSPGACEGVKKYIHEECLKTWLITMRTELYNGKCEFGHTELAMNYKVETKGRPSNICRQNSNNGMYVPLLVAVICMICLVLFLLIDEYQENPEVLE